MFIANAIVSTIIINVVILALEEIPYDFMIDIGTPNTSCPAPNYRCKDGKLHFLCTPIPPKYAKCVCQDPLEMRPEDIKSFLRGINGIRNKIAFQVNIPNMNLLYWSDELSDMAARYLFECTEDPDPCLIIGDKQLIVSQNFAVFKSDVHERWIGRVVRHWFMEIGSNLKSLDELKQKISSGTIANFTNMVYPRSEFVGCAAAHVVKGVGVFCYFYPAYNSSKLNDFIEGAVGSQCATRLNDNSRIFTSLCGADFEMRGGSLELKPAYKILSLCVFLILLFMW